MCRMRNRKKDILFSVGLDSPIDESLLSLLLRHATMISQYQSNHEVVHSSVPRSPDHDDAGDGSPGHSHRPQGHLRGQVEGLEVRLGRRLRQGFPGEPGESSLNCFNRSD